MKPAKKTPMPTPSSMRPMLPSDGGRALEDVAFRTSSPAPMHLQDRFIPSLLSQSAIWSVQSTATTQTLSRGTIRIRVTSTAHCIKTTRTNLAREPCSSKRSHISKCRRQSTQATIRRTFPASSAYAVWLHREFCRRLPDELLWVEDPGTSRRIRLTPGACARRGSRCRSAPAATGRRACRVS